MNKEQLRKTVGQTIRLRPSATDQRGQVCDDQWAVLVAGTTTLEICNQRTNHTAILGFDHIIKYTTDPASSVEGSAAGFFNVGVSVRILPDKVEVEPILTSGTGGTALDVRELNPHIIRESDEDRFFCWRGRGPIHRIQVEEQPRQLLGFFTTLCESLRSTTGLEPEFNLPSEIRGEIVYEMSPDGRARWQLLGGMNGAPGSQVLVLRGRS